MQRRSAEVTTALGGQMGASGEGVNVRATSYQATRHTFASHWVMRGGAIEKLREVLGHSSVSVTERYSHLDAELFSDRERGLIAVDLAPGKVVSKARAAGGGSE
jgi:integrase